MAGFVVLDISQEDYDERIRNKAIDEFAEKMCEKTAESSERCIFPGGITSDVISLDYISEIVIEIAEQMKGGAE